jgi:hypothetical protein
MRELLAQATDAVQPTSTSDPIHVDLSGVGAALGQWFVDNVTVVGAAIWAPMSGWLLSGIKESAEATWSSVFVAIPEMLYSLPPALTYNLQAYRDLVLDPMLMALTGATLALVLLGIRTMLGAMVGTDHVATHVVGRLIPASVACMGYQTLVVWTITRVGEIGGAVGPQLAASLFRFPAIPNMALTIPYVLLWLYLLWKGWRLLQRLAYGVFRFVLALIFGPVALLLWAIPQTEWVTRLWLHEFIGWGSSPILVAVVLAIAVPLAVGQSGFLGAVLFGSAGLSAAHDVVGLLGGIQRGGGSGSGLLGFLAGHGTRLAASAATGGAGAAIAANEVTTLAEQYGYD